MKTTLIAAISLDGFITRHDETGSGFTSPEDKLYFNKAVQEFDCLIFGGQNYRISSNWIRNRLKPEQLKVVLTRNPEAWKTEAIAGELEFTNTEVLDLLQELRARDFQNVCILGGGQIYGKFLKSGAVDEIWLTLEPLLFGNGIKLSAQSLDLRADLLSIDKLNESTLLLKYKPRNRNH